MIPITQRRRGAEQDPSTGLIPRELWEQFLNDFSRLHRETTVRIEALSPDGQLGETLLEDRPLLALSLDDEAGTPQLIVEAGDTAGASPTAVKHIVSEPTQIWARELRPGYVDAVEIVTRREGTLVLTLNPHPGRESLPLRELGRSAPRATGPGVTSERRRRGSRRSTPPGTPD